MIGASGLGCLFYALALLPLAEATVIQYLHPVFTALLAALLLRERAGAGLLLSLALGVAGVLLVARPAFLFGAASAAPSPRSRSSPRWAAPSSRLARTWPYDTFRRRSTRS